jgi:phosphomannomutase/phosphoglucomutase
VARNIAVGPEMRRGAGDLNGEGETVGGIVVVRYGQNVLQVIDRIKAKLAETGAPLAGEMSGHTFFKERWYGFDDALYAGARLLEILARHSDPSQVLESLPDSVSTPELNISSGTESPHALIDRLSATAKFPRAVEVIRIDGLRVEYADGFGLLRASNTTPVVVLRFEAESEAALKRIQAEFRSVLAAGAPGLALPF